MRSEATRAFGQPRLTKPTFGARLVDLAAERVMVEQEGKVALYSTTAGGIQARKALPRAGALRFGRPAEGRGRGRVDLRLGGILGRVFEPVQGIRYEQHDQGHEYPGPDGSLL